MSDETPTDPFSSLSNSAIQLHEYYQSFVDAGFSEEQAFSLTKDLHTVMLSIAVGTALQ